MSFVELVERIAQEAKLPKDTVAAVLRSFTRTSRSILETGESVKLTGFGTFYAKQQPPRALFGGTRTSGGRCTVKFRESRRRKN